MAVDPDYFMKLFPSPEVFFIVMRRMVLLGAIAAFSIGLVNGGINHWLQSLKFTNKVPVLEVMLVVIFTAWVVVNPLFMGAFVLIITLSTIPDHIKSFFSKIVYV
jgi:hypothetical protein